MSTFEYSMTFVDSHDRVVLFECACGFNRLKLDLLATPCAKTIRRL